jgi:hypothetical protein
MPAAAAALPVVPAAPAGGGSAPGVVICPGVGVPTLPSETCESMNGSAALDPPPTQPTSVMV